MYLFLAQWDHITDLGSIIIRFVVTAELQQNETLLLKYDDVNDPPISILSHVRA
jgi:hypothetical protein